MSTRRSLRSKPKLENLVENKKVLLNNNKDGVKKNDDGDDDDGSSSDSSVGNYLKTADEIDLNSSFFSVKAENDTSTSSNKRKSDIGRLSDLSDSDSSDGEVKKEVEKPDQQQSFQTLQNFHKKLEEAKLAVQNYNKKKEENEVKMDISNLLSAGEKSSDMPAVINQDNFITDSSEAEMDWEDVEHSITETVSKIPKEGVEITVAFPTNMREKKSKNDIIASMKRKINRIKKENQVYMHKVHLLCWIAHGNYVNSVLNSESLLGLSLSLLPSEQCYPPKHADLKYLEQITAWYKKIMKFVEKGMKKKDDANLPLEKALSLELMKKETDSKKNFVYMFICILRALGLGCRLILSLQCVPLRPPSSELCSLSTKNNEKEKEKSKSDIAKSKTDTPLKSTVKTDKSTAKTEKNKKDTKSSRKSDTKTKSSTSRPSTSKNEPEKSKPRPRRTQSTTTPKTTHDSDEDFKPQKRSLSSDKSKRSLDVRADIVKLIKGDMVKAKHSEKQKVVKSKQKVEESEDSDYVPEEPVVKKRRSTKRRDSEDDFKAKKNVRKPSSSSQIDKRVLSTDSDEKEDDKRKVKNGNDVWVEVFLEAEEKWISVDVIKGRVHCISELYSRATSPVCYILSWNNNRSIKDVTSRYCSQMNTATRKLRVDSEWWKKTLKPYVGRKTARDKEEDEDLAKQQLDQPLPKTITEYKNHPLYALKRHLLKFEALYPPDAITLGFIRNEAVYARECVHTLHSREIWLKHAKVVKPGEQAYKVVKARPKYDKLTGKVITDQPLDIFGIWQVDDYVPPTAENGIVPRNAFGNVELFKPCMLPKGTVHLQLPGLNKVARKLSIDCAPALVGFDFHSGGTHPSFDGFIVCEEFKDTLIAAWEQEQEEMYEREIKKIEKRVYDNWRKLIKGVLIRERLKAKYEFASVSDSSKGKSKKGKDPKLVAKKRRVVSDSESD